MVPHAFVGREGFADRGAQTRSLKKLPLSAGVAPRKGSAGVLKCTAHVHLVTLSIDRGTGLETRINLQTIRVTPNVIMSHHVVGSEFATAHTCIYIYVSSKLPVAWLGALLPLLLTMFDVKPALQGLRRPRNSE